MLQVSKVKDSWFPPPPLSTSAFLSWTLSATLIHPDSPRLGPKCRDFPFPAHFQILGSGLAWGGGRCVSRQGAGLGPGLCRGRGPRGGSERRWSRGLQAWETPRCSWEAGEVGMGPSSQAQEHGGWSHESSHSSFPPPLVRQPQRSENQSSPPSTQDRAKCPSSPLAKLHKGKVCLLPHPTPHPECGPLEGPQQLAAGGREGSYGSVVRPGLAKPGARLPGAEEHQGQLAGRGTREWQLCSHQG